MTSRHLVIGIDGADVDVMYALGRAQMPTLFGLMDRGAWARLRSLLPAATLPNWCSLLTGADPGTHGVFDFTTRRGMRVAFTGGTIRAVPTIAARLDRAGQRCAVLGFPGTYPPERLEHGAFISGWDAPVDFEADDSYVHPKSLEHELRSRFGPFRFDDIDEFATDARDWHARLGARLESRVERKTEVYAHILRRCEWDLFMVYFGESDTASHHLYSLWDDSSPRHPPDASLEEREGLPRVYRALDRAVARLIEQAGEGVDVTVVSDHGSGPASDKVLHLNVALAEMGFLAFRGLTRPCASQWTRACRDAALRALPAKARQTLFHALGRALPGWIESRVRFGAIDFRRTRVFSDELNYFPALHYNLRGREPEGVLDPTDVPRVFDALEAALRALRDPWSGEPVVEALWPREALYEGPFVHRAPDVIVELALDRSARAQGATYNLIPSTEARDRSVFRRMAPHEYRGRKGRSLAGSHRPRGLFIAAGPSVRACGEIDARVVDVPATVLARMGVRCGPTDAGRVLEEMLVARGQRVEIEHIEECVAPTDRGDFVMTEARLRMLGYVDS